MHNRPAIHERHPWPDAARTFLVPERPDQSKMVRIGREGHSVIRVIHWDQRDIRIWHVLCNHRCKMCWMDQSI